MTDLPPDAFSRGPRVPSRVVVSDDGVVIHLTAYETPDGPPTRVLLTPLRALAVAHELLAAGLRHAVAERNHLRAKHASPEAGARRGPT